MKTQRIPEGIFSVVEFFRKVMSLASVMTFPPRPAPIPVPVQGASGSSAARRTAPSRLTGRLPLLVGFVFLAAMPAWAGEPALPAGVPNIYDPEVRDHFQPVGVANLRGDPDFPVVILVNTTRERPEALLLALDARNGKNTWSLTTDPIILIVVFTDETTLQGLYVDTGFVDLGKPTGNYSSVDEVNFPALPDLLKALTGPARRTYI